MEEGREESFRSVTLFTLLTHSETGDGSLTEAGPRTAPYTKTRQKLALIVPKCPEVRILRAGGEMLHSLTR